MEFFEFADIVQTVKDLSYTDYANSYLWVCLVIGGCMFGIMYAFEATALYTIAKREGFKRKWMAFVPILNTYYMGVVSEKNRIFKTKAKHVAIGVACAELVYCVLGILYYVAEFKIFNGGYAEPIYKPVLVGGEGVDIIVGYTIKNLPANLAWAGWVYTNLPDYVMYWVQLLYIISNVFLLIAFFRTYSSPRYVLFAVLSAIFPIKAIFMFAVRNNRGKNYVEYLKEQQQRQYRMYQDYIRNSQNGQNGNYGAGDPYSQQSGKTPPSDPFGGLGEEKKDPFGGLGEEKKNPPDDDPFADL